MPSTRNTSKLSGCDLEEIQSLEANRIKLEGFSDDERIVQDFLAENVVDLLLIVVNSVQIDRQLALVLQLRALGLPAVLLLNMADEADKHGITIDTESLSQQLGYPVAQLSAKYGQGYPQAYKTIELTLQQLEKSPAFSAPKELDQNTLNKQLADILKLSVDQPAQLTQPLTDKLDKVLLHPWLGLPLFFGIMYLVFQAVYLLGAPLQDGTAWLLNGFRDHALVPLLSG